MGDIQFTQTFEISGPYSEIQPAELAKIMGVS